MQITKIDISQLGNEPTPAWAKVSANIGGRIISFELNENQTNHLCLAAKQAIDECLDELKHL